MVWPWIERKRYELAERAVARFQRYGFHCEDTINISLFITKKNR